MNNQIFPYLEERHVHWLIKSNPLAKFVSTIAHRDLVDQEDDCLFGLSVAVSYKIPKISLEGALQATTL